MSRETIVLWPDGTWSTLEDVENTPHWGGDDYRVLSEKDAHALLEGEVTGEELESKLGGI